MTVWFITMSPNLRIIVKLGESLKKIPNCIHLRNDCLQERLQVLKSRIKKTLNINEVVLSNADVDPYFKDDNNDIDFSAEIRQLKQAWRLLQHYLIA